MCVCVCVCVCVCMRACVCVCVCVLMCSCVHVASAVVKSPMLSHSVWKMGAKQIFCIITVTIIV